jgi:TIR domain/Pentapeptide repeats (8 copies)
MANPEHLKILEQGVNVWNQWRVSTPTTKPDLGYAVLNYEDLRGVNFSDTFLNSAYLYEANLSSAILIKANLSNTYLRGANLSDADLSSAIIHEANLVEANFTNVYLKSALLHGAHFVSTDLSGVNFDEAMMESTIFSNVDLRDVSGLETIRHTGPSTVGIDTLYKSGGSIPEVFLRGCGIPDEFISYAHSLVGSQQLIQFYSCFISYSNKDQKFADRLHSDLQSRGIRCWFAPEDLQIGAKTRIKIDESIRVHDKLLVILSKHSIESEWVEKEVETAMERERQQKRIVLFPIRLDDMVMNVPNGWAADIRRSRNIGDFRRWQNHDSYRKTFDRLVRDLKAG